MEESPASINRRSFVKTAGVAVSMLALDPISALASPEGIRLTILHTNDVHSRIEPIPDPGTRYYKMGGVAVRSSMIKAIRAKEDNVLLFDAGDIFQGTPYFNLFGGEVEMKLMSQMKYDGATMGNHDFDNALEGFEKQLIHADFPILISNYDFKNTVLEGRTRPYRIYKKAGLKIGVFGIGIQLEGLVDKKNYKETVYLDPIETANEMAATLKKREHCDLIICLSHLGYEYANIKVSDKVLAAKTRNIDLIIGGHTHTFLDKPIDIPNLDGTMTTVNQAGWSGICMGRINYHFQRQRKERITTALNYQVSPSILASL